MLCQWRARVFPIMCSLRVVDSDGDMASPSRARHKVLGIKYAFQAHFDIGPAMLHSSIIVSILIYFDILHQRRTEQADRIHAVARLRSFEHTYTIIHVCIYIRRKFRSQTSDNMDRWKSTGGKSQRREEERRSKKRKNQKERRSRCAKR